MHLNCVACYYITTVLTEKYISFAESETDIIALQQHLTLLSLSLKAIKWQDMFLHDFYQASSNNKKHLSNYHKTIKRTHCEDLEITFKADFSFKLRYEDIRNEEIMTKYNNIIESIG